MFVGERRPGRRVGQRDPRSGGLREGQKKVPGASTSTTTVALVNHGDASRETLNVCRSTLEAEGLLVDEKR